ncbi:unnamed protein product, partial [marine sediment metagenome]
MYSVLDLFSGIGCFSKGLEATSHFETKLFCEIDEDCRNVLKKHWNNIDIDMDITTLNPIGNFDIICGGFPCQDISTSGKQIGIKGSKSSLWKQFKRIINEKEPKYAIIENVQNIKNRGLEEVL